MKVKVHKKNVRFRLIENYKVKKDKIQASS